MLIFLGVQTVVDVNHLLPSMLIFSLLLPHPNIFISFNDDATIAVEWKPLNVIIIGQIELDTNILTYKEWFWTS